MAYTVKRLSALSGVTVRTLHFYEEAGLLKPAYYGENGYRYYEERELLQLQQILFFKELGFTLKQIQKVMGRSEFDQLAALHTHKNALVREWKKIGQLIKTVDKTINHLEGKKKMQEKDIFYGFNLWAKGKGSESYYIGDATKPYGPTKEAEAILLENIKDEGKQRTQAEYEEIERESKGIMSKMAQLLEKGLKPTSVEVQKLIKKHHTFAGRFHAAPKAVYKAYAQLYRAHPEYRKQLDPFHPKLAEFMAEAMEFFADRELE